MGGILVLSLVLAGAGRAMPGARVVRLVGEVSVGRDGTFAPAGDHPAIGPGAVLRSSARAGAALEVDDAPVWIGASTTVRLADNGSLQLETGRVVVGPGADRVSVRTDEAIITGSGWICVARGGGVTSVSVWAGAATVGSTTVREGAGAVASAGRPAERSNLPDPPLLAGDESGSRYAVAGGVVPLRWSPAGPTRIEVVPIEDDHLVFEIDVEGASHDLVISRPGGHRVRVVRRTSTGLESPPSGELLVHVTGR